LRANLAFCCGSGITSRVARGRFRLRIPILRVCSLNNTVASLVPERPQRLCGGCRFCVDLFDKDLNDVLAAEFRQFPAPKHPWRRMDLDP